MGSNLESENGRIIFTVDDNTCNAMLTVSTLTIIHEQQHPYLGRFLQYLTQRTMSEHLKQMAGIENEGD